MEKFNLSEMKRGWFIGNFSPTLYKTNNIEVAVKYYNAGDHEAEHFHKIAKEITVVIMGKIKMKTVLWILLLFLKLFIILILMIELVELLSLF